MAREEEYHVHHELKGSTVWREQGISEEHISYSPHFYPLKCFRYEKFS